MSPATIARTLRRVGLSRRLRLEPPPMGRRYEHAAAGDLLHLDTKKLGRIRGIGHRISGQRQYRARGIGWEFLHIAIDDHSRVAYMELLGDERGPTMGAFLRGPPMISRPRRLESFTLSRSTGSQGTSTSSAMTASKRPCSSAETAGL